MTNNNVISALCAIVIVCMAGFYAFQLVSFANTPAVVVYPAAPSHFYTTNATRYADEKSLADAVATVESSKPTVHVETFSAATDNTNGFITVSGKIHNKGDTNVVVFGYVDFYDSDNVKLDSGIFQSKPDAHGMATFKSTTTELTEYRGEYTYEIRITKIYPN